MKLFNKIVNTFPPSAYAHAGKILSQLDYFKEIDAVPTTYECRYKLAPVITEDELNQLELLI